jgi:hypothetical protein
MLACLDLLVNKHQIWWGSQTVILKCRKIVGHANELAISMPLSEVQTNAHHKKYSLIHTTSAFRRRGDPHCRPYVSGDFAG